ncbi:hypothetical protein PR001_g18668 [Phytophthora rubi]|nr:hypothetical protein PR001_g18668 [Phytophthora rubi]
MSSQLDRGQLEEWLTTLGDGGTLLDDESEVHVGTKDPGAIAMILKLLWAYRDVSVNSETTAARTDGAIIDDNVKQMHQAGVIEERNGTWGFPAVLVRKKDGEVRFCIDYRALNKVTKRDVYPLPCIDETLEALGGAQLFTTLNLRSSYWQIGVAAEDRDKTAFTTKGGPYHFIRMPFGLMNAPSTFQRMMNGVLRGLTWLTCLVYLDDIVIYAKGGIERHILELTTV